MKNFTSYYYKFKRYVSQVVFFVGLYTVISGGYNLIDSQVNTVENRGACTVSVNPSILKFGKCKLVDGFVATNNIVEEIKSLW